MSARTEEIEAGPPAKAPHTAALSGRKARSVFRRLERELLAEHGLRELTFTERERLAVVVEARVRLDELGAALKDDGLIVRGLEGQPRGHPALAEERALRREVDSGLAKISWAMGQRAMLESIRALTTAA